MNEPGSKTAPTIPVARPGTFARHVRRWLSVGVLSTVTDYSLYGLLLYCAQWSPVAANMVSRPCGGIVSFVFNKVWTFERREVRGTGGQALRYLCVWLSAYSMSNLLLWVFTALANWAQVPAKMVADAVVNSIGFLVLRHWTFRASDAAKRKMTGLETET